MADSAQQAARRSSLSASLKESEKFFRAGDFDQAALLAGRGYHDALEAGERRLAARFLLILGGCRFAEHRYQEALQTYLDARSLADAAGDRQIAGVLDFNISSLYFQL